jgi:hypothetical protein
MTVQVTTNKAGPYLGTGAQVVFPFGFKIFAVGDVVATKTSTPGTGSVESTLVQGADYTVTMNADQNNNPGGSVTLTVAPAGDGTAPNSEKLTLSRAVTETQGTGLPQAGPYNAGIVEKALDRVTILVQQLREIFGRTPSFSVSDTASAKALPSLTARKSTVLGFDANGDLTTYSPASAVTDSGNVAHTPTTGALSGIAHTVKSFLDKLGSTGVNLGAALIGFIQSGSGAVSEPVQTPLRRWCWAEQYGAVGDGVTDDYAAILRGFTAGFKVVRLMAGKNYKINTGFTFSQGQMLLGEGKSNTTLTLGADITPFIVTNVSDTGARDLLVVAFATQTAPIVLLTASTVTITRNNFDGIQVSAAALTFTPIKLRSTGAFGVWANNFRDWSISGVGTVVELNTSVAGGWVRQNRLENFYVNDFVIGTDFVRTGGDGSNENVFSKWALQASGRTTHGVRIPASSAGQNQINKFDAYTVYDLPVGGVYCDIGAGAVENEFIGPYGTDVSATSKFIDKGMRTKFRSSTRHIAEIAGFGHFLPIPTCAGWTAAVAGTGSTGQQAAYNFTRTGTTLNSTARLYTETLGGFALTTLFGINYDKPLIFRFNLARATAEANAVGRVQLKPAQAEGALAGVGLGIRVLNFALYGESYGSAGAFVDLSTILADAGNYQIEIRHYPSDRVEWWVNGVYKAQTAIVANLPSGTQTAYLVHSLITTVSNPSGDAQMFLLQPSLWVDL